MKSSNALRAAVPAASRSLECKGEDVGSSATEGGGQERVRATMVAADSTRLGNLELRLWWVTVDMGMRVELGPSVDYTQ